VSLTLKENTISNILLYTYCRNTYPKGRALMKMYRAVPITKIGNHPMTLNVHLLTKFTYKTHYLLIVLI